MSENQNGCSPSDCQGCAHAGTCNSKPQDFHKPANAKSHIRNVIAVVSGKGGVGKSMVTASLARMMREQGFSVGILDADITVTNNTTKEKMTPAEGKYMLVPGTRYTVKAAKEGYIGAGTKGDAAYTMTSFNAAFNT